MMLKFLLALILFAANISEDYFAKDLTFAEFKKWTKDHRIPDFKLHSVVKNGWIESHDVTYEALYTGKKGSVLVQLSAAEDYFEYNNLGNLYTIQEFNGAGGNKSAIAVSRSKNLDLTFIFILLPPANAALKLVASGASIRSQQQIMQLIDALKIEELYGNNEFETELSGILPEGAHLLARPEETGENCLKLKIAVDSSAAEEIVNSAEFSLLTDTKSFKKYRRGFVEYCK